jgi:integrase
MGKSKTRGNGQGTVFKQPNGKYRAEVTLGYRMVDGKRRRVCRTKSGFIRKKDALDFLETLRVSAPASNQNLTFIDLYEQWLPAHAQKVRKSTLDGYKAAFKHYAPLHFMKFSLIKTAQWQECVDACPHGERTKEVMKALGTLLYKYALANDIAERDYATHIYVKQEEKPERESFTHDEVQAIRDAVGRVKFADYILVMIYTGFRINEFVGLNVGNLDAESMTLTGGSKTAAGKNRRVPLSPVVRPIVAALAFGKSENAPLFARPDGGKYTTQNFRNSAYIPALKKIGVRPLNPHACRHTFATLLKDVDAPATDKQRLMGHASFEMTAHYTHTDTEALRRITDKLE